MYKKSGGCDLDAPINVRYYLMSTFLQHKFAHANKLGRMWSKIFLSLSFSLALSLRLSVLSYATRIMSAFETIIDFVFSNMDLHVEV